MIIRLFVIAFVVLVSSCSNNDKGLPSMTGKANEVVIVAEKNIWNGSTGNSWKEIFSEQIAMLPQPENAFDIVSISPDAFTNIFKHHRNIIICEIQPGLMSGLTIKKDVWSNGQLCFNVIAESDTVMAAFIIKNKQKIVDYLLDTEKQRIIDNYNQYRDNDIQSQLNKKFNIDLIIPKGYKIDVVKKDFAWITYETPQMSQGILIYFYDYKDTASFSKDSLIAKRNTFCKKYVPGPRSGSYMSTETNFEIFYSEHMHNGSYAARIQGLWKTEGDYMGGPFVSISKADVKRARIVTVEGYIYAPKFDKRNYLRQMDAIAQSLTIL
jgi:hypothetical protein